MPTMTRNVHLVAGGAGFIGSHIIDRLLTTPAHVICLDNLSTGTRANIEQHLTNPHFELVRHDIINAIDIEADYIWNFACPASPLHYQRDPVRTIRTNILGTANLLELAARTRATFLQASTSEVYGDPIVHPQPETYWGNTNPIGPRACYDEGKRAAETLCFDYHRQHDVSIKVARIFNTYGPRMLPNDGRVISTFVRQALQGEPLTIFGDGTHTRSFAHINDTTEALHRLMLTPHSTTGPINIGNPNEFTIRELADLILEMTNSRSRIIHMPLPTNDPRQRCPAITEAQHRLGWTPTTDLATGLRDTIEYHRARHG